MSEVTKEEIVEIVTSFLLNSPPGEFMEVVTDIRGLLSDESIINDTAPSTFREYNTEQMLQVASPGGNHRVLITKHGEVRPGEYLDPRGNQVLTFDHIRQEVTGSRAISNELDSSVESYRAAFDDAVSHYVQEHYLNGTTTVYAKKDGRHTVVTVCISSAKFNPNNFWNGRWRSVWTLKFAQPGGQTEVTGRLRVNVHYYEDGNVQLTTDTPKSFSVTGGNDPKSLADAAAKAIEKAEQDYHNKLDLSYNTMGDTTFKALRRVLPITRNRIDWAKIHQFKVGSDLKAKK